MVARASAGAAGLLVARRPAAAAVPPPHAASVASSLTSAGAANPSNDATFLAAALLRQQAATNALLAHISTQLEQQSAHVASASRAAASCASHLATIAAGMRAVVEPGVATIAAALQLLVGSVRRAEAAARLATLLRHGRLAQLGALLLAALRRRPAAIGRCSSRLAAAAVAKAAASGGGLRRLVAAARALMAGRLLQEGLRLHSGGPMLRLRCEGCFALGWLLLLAWTLHSARRGGRGGAAFVATGSGATHLLAGALGGVHALDALVVVGACEATIGAAAMALMGGRWWLWLALWEAWLAVCIARALSPSAQVTASGGGGAWPATASAFCSVVFCVFLPFFCSLILPLW